MKTRNIKKRTLVKCLAVLNELKYRADNNIFMDAGSIIAKYSTSDTIPSAARALNYFEAKSPNIWICKKDKFEPMDARKLLDFIYDKAEKRRNTKNQSKDSPPFLVSYPLDHIKKPEEKMRVGFIPPTIQEVKDYCKFKDIDIDAKHFHSYYESVGWLVGKKKMQKWKSAIHTWERSKYNKVFVKGEISGYSNEEISNEFKKRGLSCGKLNEYSDNELTEELKNRGYSGGIKKDISF